MRDSSTSLGMTMNYVELHACSAFSFLRGGSFPEQLAEVAAELEIPAMALLDRNGVYGAQRFSVAAREHNVRPIIGCELSMGDGSVLPVLVENRTGYKNLCELLTQAHLRSEKGTCAVRWHELPQFAEGLVAFFGLGSTGCQPVVCGSLPQTSFHPWRANTQSVRQAAGRDRLAACAPQSKERHQSLRELG
jgi:DNA polymerase III alpha subunit